VVRANIDRPALAKAMKLRADQKIIMDSHGISKKDIVEAEKILSRATILNPVDNLLYSASWQWQSLFQERTEMTNPHHEKPKSIAPMQYDILLWIGNGR